MAEDESKFVPLEIGLEIPLKIQMSTPAGNKREDLLAAASKNALALRRWHTGLGQSPSAELEAVVKSLQDAGNLSDLGNKELRKFLDLTNPKNKNSDPVEALILLDKFGQKNRRK